MAERESVEVGEATAATMPTMKIPLQIPLVLSLSSTKHKCLNLSVDFCGCENAQKLSALVTEYVFFPAIQSPGINQLAMGCCCSIFNKDNSPQGTEANERTHLLVDPVSNNTNIPRVHSDDYVNQYANSLPKKTDEQSALNRILHETAANVIDVGALDSHNLEQHEYIERSRAYAKRIETCGVKVFQKIPCLLADIPAPERVLAAEPLSSEDQELITNMLKHAVAALADIKVEHKEDLVVPFLA